MEIVLYKSAVRYPSCLQLIGNMPSQSWTCQASRPGVSGFSSSWIQYLCNFFLSLRRHLFLSRRGSSLQLVSETSKNLDFIDTLLYNESLENSKLSQSDLVTVFSWADSMLSRFDVVGSVCKSASKKKICLRQGGRFAWKYPYCLFWRRWGIVLKLMRTSACSWDDC